MYKISYSTSIYTPTKNLIFLIRLGDRKQIKFLRISNEIHPKLTIKKTSTNIITCYSTRFHFD